MSRFLQLITILCGACALMGASAEGRQTGTLPPPPQSDVSVCLTSRSIWTGGGGFWWEGGPGICGVTDEAAEFSYDGRLESGCECLIDR